MGLFEQMKVWRMGGAAFATRPGAAVYQRTGGLLNRLAAATMAPPAEGPVPWSRLGTLTQTKVTMITTAGLHVDGDLPFDIDAKNGDPTFRELPGTVDGGRLRVAHTHYPQRYFEQDYNVVFPIDRLRELETAGILRLSPRFFSYGFAGGQTRRLIDPEIGTAHRVAAELRDDGVGLALLVPV